MAPRTAKGKGKRARFGATLTDPESSTHAQQQEQEQQQQQQEQQQQHSGDPPRDEPSPQGASNSELEGLRSQLTLQNSQITQLNSKLADLSLQPQLNMHQGLPLSARLPRETFDGKDPDNSLPPFVWAMKHFVSTTQLTTQQAVYAVSRCLTGQALEWYEQESSESMHPYETSDELLEALKRQFITLGRVDKARDELHTLTFNNDLVAYVQKFRRLYLILKKEITPSTAAESFFRPLPLPMRQQISLMGKDHAVEDIEQHLLILAKENRRNPQSSQSTATPSNSRPYRSYNNRRPQSGPHQAGFTNAQVSNTQGFKPMPDRSPQLDAWATKVGCCPNCLKFASHKNCNYDRSLGLAWNAIAKVGDYPPDKRTNKRPQPDRPCDNKYPQDGSNKKQRYGKSTNEGLKYDPNPTKRNTKIHNIKAQLANLQGQLEKWENMEFSKPPHLPPPPKDDPRLQDNH